MEKKRTALERREEEEEERSLIIDLRSEALALAISYIQGSYSYIVGPLWLYYRALMGIHIGLLWLYCRALIAIL